MLTLARYRIITVISSDRPRRSTLLDNKKVNKFLR
jgi:hypothetical protein